jgi:putative NADPH-quinone reductase
MNRIPVLFSCSHRRSGNSDRACELFLEGLRASGGDGEIVYLGDYDFVPCNGCGKCRTSPDHHCVHIKKDAAQSFFEKMMSAPLVFFASPIYFYHLPSRFKTFIDRGQWGWEAGQAMAPEISSLPVRPAYCMMVAGRPKGERLFQGAELTLKFFLDFFHLKMQPPLLFRGIDGPEDLAENSEISELIVDSGKKAWLEYTGNKNRRP